MADQKTTKTISDELLDMAKGAKRCFMYADKGSYGISSITSDGDDPEFLFQILKHIKETFLDTSELKAEIYLPECGYCGELKPFTQIPKDHEWTCDDCVKIIEDEDMEL